MTAAPHHTPQNLHPATPAVRPRPAGVHIDGVAFDRLSEAGTIRYLIDELRAGRGGWVITSNLDHLARARRDPEFRAMLDEADLVIADGAPLVWASRLQGTPLPERVAGSALAWSLTGAAAAAGKSIFLLGGDKGTAEKAAQHLKGRFADLSIAGTFYPPMGFEKDPEIMAAMRAALIEARPDLVYVALGSPKQERLIRELRSDLPGAWWLGLGISLSFICGEVQRAPVWMQKIGLEWFHRMIQEPRRLARRYLVDGIPFGLRLVSSAVVKRFSGQADSLIRAEQRVESGVVDAGSGSERTRDEDGSESWGV